MLNPTRDGCGTSVITETKGPDKGGAAVKYSRDRERRCSCGSRVQGARGFIYWPFKQSMRLLGLMVLMYNSRTNANDQEQIGLLDLLAGRY